MSLYLSKYFPRTLSGGLFFLYPYAVYKFLSEHTAFYYIVGIVVVSVLRGAYLIHNKANILKKTVFIVRVISLVAIVPMAMIILYLFKTIDAPLFYPVVMSLSMSFLFFITLIFPPTIIEIFANIQCTDKVVVITPSYFKNLTIIWGCFCLGNAGIAFITILANNRILWTLYNGCLSYCFMGALFIGEMMYRKRLVNKMVLT